MNRKIVITWAVLILIGFIAFDFINNFFVLSCLWIGIIILGSTVIVKYGWQQSKYLCIYWIATIVLGAVLSGIQYNYTAFPIQHISTIWMFIFGINFLITAYFSKIIFFGPLGFVMLAVAIPLDGIKMSFPGLTYGILLSIILMGYIALTYLTPNDKFNLGHNYNDANGLDEENLTHMHKFKCSNCGYIYEGHEKLNYCPRCMAGADLLVDVD